MIEWIIFFDDWKELKREERNNNAGLEQNGQELHGKGLYEKRIEKGSRWVHFELMPKKMPGIFLRWVFDSCQTYSDI